MVKNVPISEVRMAVDLVWRVFSEFVAPDYIQQGIDNFKKYIDHNNMVDNVEHGKVHFLGYYYEKQLVGVLAFENRPHISLLYVDKDYHKQGIGRVLIAEFKKYCKQQFTSSIITLNASPYAHDFYKKLGFYDTSTEQTINGIRFYPMEKELE